MRRTADDIYDEWLVLRCQTGEEPALRELFQRWHARLSRHARRLVDHTDDAADVVQEAWLAIVRGLTRLDDPARFGAWAYRIVTFKCRDWTRRRARDRAHGMHGAPHNTNTLVTPEPSAAPDPDEAAALHRAMRELSPAHRATLALHYLEEFGVAEIAVAMAVPRGTVKSRLHHGREKLRTIIERNES